MLGWLHVTPEGEKQTRAQLDSWPLPDCDKFNYLVSWFCELRLSFGFIDVQAWIELTGSKPNPIEIDLLMSMTRIYSNSMHEYHDKSHNLTPPIDCRTAEQKDAMIAEKMKRSLARFKDAN